MRKSTRSRITREARPDDSRIFGYDETIELLQRGYVWTSMRTDGKSFVSQCDLNARNKPSRRRPYDLL